MPFARDFSPFAAAESSRRAGNGGEPPTNLHPMDFLSDWLDFIIPATAGRCCSKSTPNVRAGQAGAGLPEVPPRGGRRRCLRHISFL